MMDFKDFELIYKENRVKINDISKIESDLREIVGANNVSTKKIDLLAYTKDSTLIGFNWLLEGKISGLANFSLILSKSTILNWQTCWLAELLRCRH